MYGNMHHQLTHFVLRFGRHGSLRVRSHSHFVFSRDTEFVRCVFHQPLDRVHRLEYTVCSGLGPGEATISAVLHDVVGDVRAAVVTWWGPG